MKKYLRAIILLGLYTFFYLVLELIINDLAAPVIGGSKVALLYGVSYLTVAIGYPLYFLFKRLIKNEKLLQVVFAIAGCINLIFLLILANTSISWLFVVLTLFTHLTAGYIGGVVYHFIAEQFREAGKIGLFLGFSYAGSCLVQIIGLIPASALPVDIYAWIEGGALVLALGLIYWLLFINTPTIGTEEIRIIKTAPNIKKYLWGALAAMVLIAMMQGITDGIITSLHAQGGEFIAYGFPRIFAVAGLMVSGIIADIKNRKLFPYCTVLAMIFLVLSVLFFMTPETYNIALSCVYFFGSFMSMYSAVNFIEIAPSTSTPALTAVSGRMTRYFFAGLAIIFSGQLFESASMTALIVTYVIFVALLFTVFFFMGQLHIPSQRQLKKRNADYLEELTKKYALTTRETEILALLVKGEAISDIAAQLFLSEKTIRNYIGKLVTKTGTLSRADLIEMAKNYLNPETTESP